MDKQTAIAAAWIGGICVIVGAIIGGVFLIVNTLIENGVIITGPSVSPGSVQVGGPGLSQGAPQEPIEAQTPTSTATAIPLPTNTPIPPTSTPVPTPTRGLCNGRCWEYDHSTRTMTWTGPTNGMEDIHQADGEPLDIIRSGYTAIFETTIPMKILICIGEVDGKTIAVQCNSQIIDVAPGVHRVVSPGPQGGFRVQPDR